MSRSLVRSTLTAFAGLALVGQALAAQTPAQILERYNKAVDPQGQIAGVQGMKTTLEMSVPAMGMSMTINSVMRRPNQLIVETDIPGVGVVRQGYDGTTAWAMDPMQGPRILSGAEAAALVEGSTFNNVVRTADLFSAMEAAGTAEVGGEATTCVKFTWKSGRESTDCFSNTSGLLLSSKAKQVSQMGEVEVEVFLKDYRNVNGLLVPHRTETNMMGMQMVATTTLLEFGPQAAALFELPAEIKALKP